MNLWAPIDWLADWLRHQFGVQAQLRMGVLMVLIGLLYFVYFPFADEPPAVFTMSAFALIFAGIGVVVSAETLKEVVASAEQVDDTAEEVAQRCEVCGR